MKSGRPPRIDKDLFRIEPHALPVRVIKASQANKLLHTHGKDDKAQATGPRPAPVVRMVASGADYTDLEISCGCGEKVTVRCWNNNTP